MIINDRKSFSISNELGFHQNAKIPTSSKNELYNSDSINKNVHICVNVHLANHQGVIVDAGSKDAVYPGGCWMLDAVCFAVFSIPLQCLPDKLGENIVLKMVNITDFIQVFVVCY